MTKLAIFEKATGYGADIAARGHHVVYRTNETNRCPGCGRAHWYVGRITAECSFCGTAIALAETELSAGGNRTGRRSGTTISADKSWEERREHERVATTGRTLQLLVDGSPRSFAIENLSAGGLKGRDPVGLAAGAALQVRFEGGILVPASVKWIEGELMGLEFSAPLTLDLPRRRGR